MSEEKKTIKVVAAIIMRDGKCFATERGYGDYKDWWEFPGGKVEPGETNEEALMREIREELDSEIGIDRFFCSVEHDYPKFFMHMDCYICSLVSGKLDLLEHEDAKWLGMDELDSVRWLPSDIEVLEKLKAEVAGAE